MRAFLSYRRYDLPLSFWRTSSGFEVDLIVGGLDVALEFKSLSRVRDADLKGMRMLLQEHNVGRCIVVCREGSARRTEDGIEILPWREFCGQLWEGGVIVGRR